jgi:hypothetical protein
MARMPSTGDHEWKMGGVEKHRFVFVCFVVLEAARMPFREVLG